MRRISTWMLAMLTLLVATGCGSDAKNASPLNQPSVALAKTVNEGQASKPLEPPKPSNDGKPPKPLTPKPNKIPEELLAALEKGEPQELFSLSPEYLQE